MSDQALLAENISLKNRLRKLSEEKANLYLVLHMVEQLNPVAGIDSLLDSLMSALCSNMGGSNVEIYYTDEGCIHYASLLGERHIISEIDDYLVKEVFEHRHFVEHSTDLQHTLLTENIAAVACTWVMPLLVGEELIGVIKMTDLLGSAQMRDYLKPFFSHMALILNNQIKTRKAESANKAKSNFLATISHEIRTPLNGILGMAQLLTTQGNSPERQQEYAKIILDSGKMLLNLLNDVLDLSKIEASKLVLTEERAEPQTIINEVLVLFVENARLKNLKIDAVWKGAHRQCYRFDSVRVRQMLSNYVSNAVKFTEYGQIHIVADELLDRDEQVWLEFSVIDTGIGIALDKQHLLFKSFSQIDDSSTRQYGGSGLGLSIVNRLAELMHGCVGVDSHLSQGSRFWFRIPVIKFEYQTPIICDSEPSGQMSHGLDIDDVFYIDKTNSSDYRVLPDNQEEALQLMDELEQLLDKNMFNAVDQFKQLQEVFHSHPIAPRLLVIGRLIADMKFKQANSQLQQLRIALGWVRR